MIGFGTIINCGSVLAGASAGMLLKNGLSKRFEDTIMQGIGLCTMFIGIGGALSGLLTLENGQLATQHTMLLILSLALGALIGEALNIEKHLEDFGVFCQNRLKSHDDSHFVEGFVSFSLLICIGAMAIVGSMQDGLSGDPSMLIAKAIIDGIAAVVFAASLGKGVFLSVLPLGVYQGGLTLHPSVDDRRAHRADVVRRLGADLRGQPQYDTKRQDQGRQSAPGGLSPGGFLSPRPFFPRARHALRQNRASSVRRIDLQTALVQLCGIAL